MQLGAACNFRSEAGCARRLVVKHRRAQPAAKRARAFASGFINPCAISRRLPPNDSPPLHPLVRPPDITVLTLQPCCGGKLPRHEPRVHTAAAFAGAGKNTPCLTASSARVPSQQPIVRAERVAERLVHAIRHAALRADAPHDRRDARIVRVREPREEMVLDLEVQATDRPAEKA